MIPMRYINEWRHHAPWQQDTMIEQDLIISRALIELFNHETLSKTLAFRGGTALHKLFFYPAQRYSEDIDLVQLFPEPIGNTFDIVRQLLDPWLGEPRRKLKDGRANLYYHYFSESVTPIKMRLKIEINTREHFSILPHEKISLSCNNNWFSGSTKITSFHFNELIATKLRALYQRKKGRDLFDLWLAIEHPNFNAAKVLQCFQKYITNSENLPISRAMFEENLQKKLQDPIFITDITPLITIETNWNIKEAFNSVYQSLICKLPGNPWAGIQHNTQQENIEISE